MKTSASTIRYLEFSIGQQNYAIPLLSVKEVLQKPEIISVPNMPKQFEGMINIRGQIIGVFDVSIKLGTKHHRAQDEKPVLIVVEYMNELLAMTVDKIIKVLHVQDGELKNAPLKESDPAAKYIKSVVPFEEDMVLVIDPISLLEFDKKHASLSA